MLDDPGRNVLLFALASFLVVLLADLGVWTWLRRQVQQAALRVGIGLPAWIRKRLYIAPATSFSQATTSSDALVDTPSADEIYLATVERLLDSQVATNDILDTKTAGTVGVGSTILPLTFGLLSITGKPLPEGAGKLLAIAVIVYVALLVAAARASVIRAIEFRPDVPTLWRHSQDINGSALRRWIADEYAASVELNRPVLQRKARWVGYANLALYAEGILVSLAAIFSLMG